MDYISREAALNFEMSVECSPDEIQGITDGMALYAEYIKQLPSANVVEVVHAEWIDDKSNCFVESIAEIPN